MSLIKCGHCGRQYSIFAEHCPQCLESKNPKKVAMKPCRSCGALLPAHHKRYEETSFQYMRDGNTRFHTSWFANHVPCTKCGDPEPLKTFLDHRIVRGLLGNVIWLSSVLIFLAGSWFTVSNSRGYAGTGTWIGIGLSLLVAVLVYRYSVGCMKKKLNFDS